jgi:hypothetical protein
MGQSNPLVRIRSQAASWFKHRSGPVVGGKLVAFCFDDYGNIRLKSKGAREFLASRGLKPANIFDNFDCLETSDDLTALMETLSSVRGHKGENAKLTALACPCNISFTKMRQSNFRSYAYELLPETYSRLGHQYSGNTSLWQEAGEKGLIRAEFHGREHLNLRVVMDKFRTQSPDILACVEADSLARLTPLQNNRTPWTAAFGGHTAAEVNEHREIIRDGVKCFASVFLRPPRVFNAPGSSECPSLHADLKQLGFTVIESPFFQWQRRVLGWKTPRINLMRPETAKRPAYIVRNCVFEPNSNPGFDWVEFTVKQIETAFEHRKPVIISSHRVNFCGGVSEENRAAGLESLRRLLHTTISRWPDVEFVFLDELATKIGLCR